MKPVKFPKCTCYFTISGIHFCKVHQAAFEMLEVLERQQANIRRWIDTGIPADAKESQSISNQIDEAIAKARGK